MAEQEHRAGEGEGEGGRAAGRTDPAAQISREICRIQEESYGVGGNRVETHLVGDLYVLCVIENELTVAERTLIENGKGDAVRETRMAFQEAIEPTFSAVVERAMGRRVDAFVSHFHLEPMFSVEFFRLAPAASMDDGPAEPD